MKIKAVDKFIDKIFNSVNTKIIRDYWNVNKFDGQIVFSRNWYDLIIEEKQYLENGNKDYKPEDVVYEINEYHFRTSSDTNNLTGDKTIACFGCSNTFGYGLPWGETWPSIIRKNFGNEYIVKNYGFCGASNESIARTIYNYLQFNKPNVICCFLPDIARMEYYSNDMYQTFCPAGNFYADQEDYDAYVTIFKPENCVYNFIKNFKFIEAFCKINNVDFYWYTWSSIILNLNKDIIKNYLNYDNFLTNVVSTPDELFNLNKARDNCHFGKDLHKRIGDKFSEKIFQKNKK